MTFPVISPAKPVAVNTPELELKVKFVPLFGAKSPVAAVVNSTLQDVSLDSSATVTAVATAAVPEYPLDVIVPNPEPPSENVIVPLSASRVIPPPLFNVTVVPANSAVPSAVMTMLAASASSSVVVMVVAP